MAEPILEGYVPSTSNVRSTAVRQVERSRRKHGNSPGQAGIAPPGATYGGVPVASPGLPGATYNPPMTNPYTRQTHFGMDMGPSSGQQQQISDFNNRRAQSAPGDASKNASQLQSSANDTDLLYQESMDKLNNAERIFSLLETLQSENLSPAAQQQLEYLREDTAQDLADIDYRLTQAVQREAAFNMMAERGAARTDAMLQQGRDIVNNSRASTNAGINQETAGGLNAIGRVFDEAAAGAVEALPTELAAEGDLSFVMGGAEHRERRAANEQAAAESARELQSLVESNVSSSADFSRRLNEASSRAANSQLDLMGIQDEKARLQAQIEMEQGIRNEVYNLTTQRRDIEKSAERMERALREEDAQAQAGFNDRFGLGVDPTPDGMWDTTFTDSMESWMSRSKMELGYNDDANFKTLATQYAALGTATSPQVEMEKEQILMNMSAVSGLSPDEIRRGLDSSVTSADRVFKDLSSADYSRAQPGSAMFGHLVYQTAVDMNVDPQTAVQWANSPALHEIIRTMSNGKPGSERGGNLRGLGGIPEDIYEAYGVPWEDAKGDPKKEMEVFLAYLMAHSNGDPSALASEMLENKSIDYTEVRSGMRRKYGN